MTCTPWQASKRGPGRALSEIVAMPRNRPAREERTTPDSRRPKPTADCVLKGASERVENLATIP